MDDINGWMWLISFELLLIDWMHDFNSIMLSNSMQSMFFSIDFMSNIRLKRQN